MNNWIKQTKASENWSLSETYQRKEKKNKMKTTTFALRAQWI